MEWHYLNWGLRRKLSLVTYPWTIKKEATDEILPKGKSMLEIFEEIGVGRSLLILGGPGSGKTTMLLELTRQLIECARQDEIEPIPVVFHLGSWNEKQTLADWLAEQLHLVYYVPVKIAPIWVHENRLLLLLDGLDEVKQGRRATCVDAINHFRKEHGLVSLAVCSRIEEYSALNTKLSLDGAVKLQPLTPQQINDYIDNFGNSLAKVRLLLGKDDIFQELAKTPLMLNIMALVSKELNANELLATNSIKDQRKYLFNTYTERMFDRLRSANPHFTKQETLHYLHWLARTMFRQNIMSYQIEFMQPSWLEEQLHRRLYKSRVGLVVGLIVGLVLGLMSMFLVGPLGVLFVGLTSGLSAGWAAVILQSDTVTPGSTERIFMVDRLNWSWRKARRGWLVTLIVWLLGLFSVWLLSLFDVWVADNYVRMVLFFSLGGSLFVGVTFGMTPEQIEETTYPGQRIKQNSFLCAIFYVDCGTNFRAGRFDDNRNSVYANCWADWRANSRDNVRGIARANSWCTVGATYRAV